MYALEQKDKLKSAWAASSSSSRKRNNILIFKTIAIE